MTADKLNPSQEVNAPIGEDGYSMRDLVQDISIKLGLLFQRANVEVKSKTVTINAITKNGNTIPVSSLTHETLGACAVLHLEGWQQLVSPNAAYDAEEIVSIFGKDELFVTHGETIRGVTLWQKIHPITNIDDVQKISAFVEDLRLPQTQESPENPVSAA
jgi:hypothetical protein